jgi:glycosyltransferase involved in cell wall biosynthesis
MRILWVKAGKLLPVDTGGKIRSYNILKQLAVRHDVVLLSYYSGARDLAYERAIRDHFPAAAVIYTGAGDGRLGGVLHYAGRLAWRAPYAVSKFTSPAVRRAVAERLDDGTFEVAVCDFLSASLNFPYQPQVPCVLFQHNVESVLWRRQARHESNWAKRTVFKLEALKMGRYERATVARFPHVIAVSERDREELSLMTDPSRITVVPTGVDLQQYRAAVEDRQAHAAGSQPPTVLFLGSMDWEPNVDAVEYFCREIWPAVIAKVPSAMFRIVGRNPHPRVRKLACNSVQVTGTVPSVIEHLTEAVVFAVPLRVGGGTRLKIFEAMAAGKAVVSTSVGAEGLDVTDGQDVILADTAPEFAAAVIEVLESPGRRRALESAAVRLAAQYDWSIVTERFERALMQAIEVGGATVQSARTVLRAEA